MASISFNVKSSQIRYQYLCEGIQSFYPYIHKAEETSVCIHMAFF